MNDTEFLDLLEGRCQGFLAVQINRVGHEFVVTSGQRAGYGKTLREALECLANHIADQVATRLTK